MMMRDAIAGVLKLEANRRLNWRPPTWDSYIPSLISATNHSSTDRRGPEVRDDWTPGLRHPLQLHAEGLLLHHPRRNDQAVLGGQAELLLAAGGLLGALPAHLLGG
ncbi:unnamed protein product [Nezara viridula]|uniref:Uncharacterized protein n=1 Tax=Nezara viridula TaxID=85310 RepID=A0A9P0MP30_NEZVI|nr:unnamed protein product [Nezara viridula]